MKMIPFSKQYNSALLRKVKVNTNSEITLIWPQSRPSHTVRRLIFREELNSHIYSRIALIFIVFISLSGVLYLPTLLFQIGQILAGQKITIQLRPFNYYAIFAAIIYNTTAAATLHIIIKKHMECSKFGKPTVKLQIAIPFAISIIPAIFVYYAAKNNLPVVAGWCSVLVFPAIFFVSQILAIIPIAYSLMGARSAIDRKSDHVYISSKLISCLKHLTAIERKGLGTFGSSKKAYMHLLRVCEHFAYRFKPRTNLRLGEERESHNLKLAARYLSFANSAKLLKPGEIQELRSKLQTDLQLISNQEYPDCNETLPICIPERPKHEYITAFAYIAIGILVLIGSALVESNIFTTIKLDVSYKYASISVGCLLIARGIFGKIRRIHDFVDSIKEIIEKIERVSGAIKS